MSKKNVSAKHKPKLLATSTPPEGTRSMEDATMAAASKSSLTGLRWHSAPSKSAEHDDDRRKTTTTAVFRTTAVIDVSGAGGGAAGSSKPLQRQKVVMGTPTMEDDDDGGDGQGENEPIVTLPPEDGDSDKQPAKRSTGVVRRGYSCQAAGSGGGGTAAGENRKRWLSADTAGSQPSSKSMENLPSRSTGATAVATTAATTTGHHNRASFIMAGADDRKSLDSCLENVVEWADRRRGLFASTRTSVPSHLSLAPPSVDRRMTILSPHSHQPSGESCWHFSASTSSASSSHTVVTRARKKTRSGMVLPRLVLPGSDLDLFSQ